MPKVLAESMDYSSHAAIRIKEEKGTKSSLFLNHENESDSKISVDDCKLDWLYACTLCGKRYKKKEGLKLHMFIHTGKRPHSCHICWKSFKIRSTLRTHLVTHESEETKMSYACYHCDKRFVRNYSLQCHLRKVTNDTTFQRRCQVCGKGYIKWYELRSHMKSHHTKINRGFQCYFCLKHFTDNKRRAIERHILKCTVSSGCSCKICGKQYFHPLLGHICSTCRRQCAYCYKEYYHIEHLRRHVVAHFPYRDRPYGCKLCGTRYISKQNLNGHTLSQLHRRKIANAATSGNASLTGCATIKEENDILQQVVDPKCRVSTVNVKEIACKGIICKKCGRQHDDDPLNPPCANSRFQCGHCYKEFNLKCILRRHIFTHFPYNERPYGCKFCGARLLSKQALHYHTHSKLHGNTTVRPDADRQGLAFTVQVKNKTNGGSRCKKCGHQLNNPLHGCICENSRFQCGRCSKEFCCKNDLEDHILAHFSYDNRPYSCNLCEKRYVSKYTLIVHTNSKLHRNNVVKAVGSAAACDVKVPAFGPITDTIKEDILLQEIVESKYRVVGVKDYMENTELCDDTKLLAWRTLKEEIEEENNTILQEFVESKCHVATVKESVDITELCEDTKLFVWHTVKEEIEEENETILQEFVESKCHVATVKESVDNTELCDDAKLLVWGTIKEEIEEEKDTILQ